MLRFLIIAILLSTSAAAQNDEDRRTDQIDYFSSENILKFADHLFEMGDYLRAAGEYQRYLIATSHEPSSDSIYYKTIRALFNGNDFTQCHKYLDSYDRYYPQSPRVAEIDLLKAIVYGRERNYEKSIEAASSAKADDGFLKSLILALNYTKLGDLEKAREISCLSNESVSRELSPVLNDLDNLCDKLRSADLRYKSPLLATSLAIVPGAGKLYCGNVGDALNSLIVIGLLGYLSYDGFHDDGVSSVRGWVFGTLGSGFYAGSIYGSAIAARLYNQKLKDEFIMGIGIDITLP